MVVVLNMILTNPDSPFHGNGVMDCHSAAMRRLGILCKGIWIKLDY